MIYGKCKICGKDLYIRNRIYCSNTCKFKDPELNKIRGIKANKNPTTKRLECQTCRWQTKDVYNYSGCVTKHTEETGHANFKIINILPIKTIKCPYCKTWETIDIENKAGALTRHLHSKHNKTITECIADYPEYSRILNGIVYNRIQDLINNNKNHVTCQLCGEKFGRITYTHLKKEHNMTLDAYHKMFPNAKTLSKKIVNINSESMSKVNESLSPNYISKPEKELVAFLKEDLHISNIITNDRTILGNLELDIYLPEYNFAIEFDGYPWHSEFFGHKTKQYHLTKTLNCAKKGIRLVHIFFDEFNTADKKELVYNRITHILNKSLAKRIFARKCEVSEISANIKNKFLDKYHIQGSIRSKYKIGAFYNNILVGVMTFSPVRRALGSLPNKGYFEMTRFATNHNYIVVGIAGKLFKYFIRTYNNIINKVISYADFRWSNGNLYEQLGFDFVKRTKPNYWYVIQGQRKHRYGFRKHRLKELFPNYYCSDKSEIEIMLEIGIDRIWDCGHLRYDYLVN